MEYGLGESGRVTESMGKGKVVIGVYVESDGEETSTGGEIGCVRYGC